MKTAITLSLALSSFAFVSSAAAGDLYAAFYETIPTPGTQTLYTGQTESQLAQTFAQSIPQNLRIADVEAYYDGGGQLRFNSVYETGSGGVDLIIGKDVATTQARILSNVGQGVRVKSMTSVMGPDGERRYTVAFRPDVGGFHMEFDKNTGAIVSNINTQAANNLWPIAVETYLNAQGKRRWDAIFGTQVNSDWEIGHSLAESTFINRIAAQEALGRDVLVFEAYRTINLTTNYFALFGPGIAGQSFGLSQDFPTFLTDYQNAQGQGKKLVDMSVLIEVTDSDWNNYGAGLAGTNGVPALTLNKDPNLGLDIEINIGNSSPTDTLCVFFTGLSATSIPLLGGEFLVNPLSSFSFILPAAGMALPVTLPADPALDGFEVYNQIVQLDNGGPFGVSISRGMKMTFGRVE